MEQTGGWANAGQKEALQSIEVALEMLAGKVREGISADPAQGVVVLAEDKEEKMAAATNG